MPNSADEKRALRRAARAALAAVSEDSWRAWCALIQERLLGHESVRSGAGVLAFVGVPAWREFDTGPLCRALLVEGRRLALPVADWASSVRDGPGVPAPGALWITDWDRDVVADPATVPGGSMRAPRAGLPAAQAEDVDLAIVPGLAFDARGGRLGRGAGFYDRVLGRLRPSAWVVAPAFECQIVGDVPMDPHDRRVHAIVTERRVIEVSRPG